MGNSTVTNTFLEHCLLVDVEVNEHNSLYAIGASRGKRHFSITAAADGWAREQFGSFDGFAEGSTYLVGHNILQHDIPHLQKNAPELKLLHKPAIDTLFLSPLACPERPYHRLNKNYQHCDDSISKPLNDALLSRDIFSQQWQKLQELQQQNPLLASLYRSFLQQNDALGATATALGMMGIPDIAPEQLPASFQQFAQQYCCADAVQAVAATIDGSNQSYLAYVCAWLSVAEQGCRIPQWVLCTFPEVLPTIQRLRTVDCEDPNCTHCAKIHNPQYFLQKYWNLVSFRPTPKNEQGESLQKQIIEAAARRDDLFVTLPTGSGKSLCYLLPALMHSLHDNSLSIIISPLQALMRNQIQQFHQQTGSHIAAALHGGITLPERRIIFENLRQGQISILYISPEQLRNHSLHRALLQRHIAAWIIDEAHCLSQWGHDFRTDYYFALRAIREIAQKQQQQVPAIQCFTATAKHEVRKQIQTMVFEQLGKKLQLYSSCSPRENLQRRTIAVEPQNKFALLQKILQRTKKRDGACLIYCASIEECDNLAISLQQQGYQAESYHGKLEQGEKDRIFDGYLNGEIDTLCATTAFGMGINKRDIRLLIHYQLPGSIENYVQESGRAGRDGKAALAMLFYNQLDLEKQFALASLQQLSRREIAQILRAIRHIAKGADRVIVTARDLLSSELVESSGPHGYSLENRVVAAISWLERAGFIRRDFNNTMVFQGEAAELSIHEARQKISGLELSRRNQKRWLEILTIFKQKGSEGVSSEELASLPTFSNKGGRQSLRVLRTLDNMAQQGLLKTTTALSAYIRYKVRNHSAIIFKKICAIENDLIDLLAQQQPTLKGTIRFDIRQANQRLLQLGHDETSPEVVRSLLYALQNDGRGMAQQRGSIKILRHGSVFSLKLLRDWPQLRQTLKLRQEVTKISLERIIDSVNDTTLRSKKVLVNFTLEKILLRLKLSTTLHGQLRDPLAACERGLTFLHELRIIILQQGLAVFRQAMTIELLGEPKRNYLVADFAPLQEHYHERTLQIHTIQAYASASLRQPTRCNKLLTAYFRESREESHKHFFPGDDKLPRLATGRESYDKIVTSLHNPVQESIVTAASDKNILVLAGPGSGKTRVVVHRIAYLLRAERIPGRAILVLTFNRGAALSIRKRLHDLVGPEANRVGCHTFHGLALKLTGRSLAIEKESNDFSELIREAIELLAGEREPLGIDPDMAYQTLVGQYSHILVDEYQDIDAQQYQLISLLAGRRSQEIDKKMHLFAVGDDDQNIYSFRGAHLAFIQKFREDYQANCYSLLENYRSSRNIIDACNSVIRDNDNRMKQGEDICINSARRLLPAGGRFIPNSSYQGKVSLIPAADNQAELLSQQLARIEDSDPCFNLNRCAILAREWRHLDPIRAALEKAKIPIALNWSKNRSFPPLEILRENASILATLQQNQGREIELEQLIAQAETITDSIWQQNIVLLLRQWQELHGETTPASMISEYLHESFRDQNRNTMLGNGIYLATAHSVKGLEFDHVFILGDGWQKACEDERRLYYVAMSRARQSLHLFYTDDTHPYIAKLSGDYLQRLPPTQITHKQPPAQLSYHLLGLEDLFMDYAGTKKAGDECHQALSELCCGQRLNLHQSDDSLQLRNQDQVIVAVLSKKASSKWLPLQQHVIEVRVVAIAQRVRQRIKDPGFKSRCQSENWELPIVEFVCKSVNSTPPL